MQTKLSFGLMIVFAVGLEVKRSPFSLLDPANLVQGVELNRDRLETRGLICFAATAEQVCVRAVAQAARQTRASDRPEPKSDGIETDWPPTIAERPPRS